MSTTSLSQALAALARNHVWSWRPELADLLASLPTAAPEQHPFAAVLDLTEAQLEALAADAEFSARVAAQLAILPTVLEDPEVIYLSAEFGITDVVPQYSGGLGILAGDHLKSASDINVSLAGIGLFYRQGFFRQGVKDGQQSERYESYTPENFGLVDTGIRVTVPVADRQVVARVWRMAVGQVPLILLDTDVAENKAHDRLITDRLYSGDEKHRIEQEMILGVGGAMAAEALGWTNPVCHLNEGHAGFLTLHLLDAHIAKGATLDEAVAAIGARLVFTTHTPVPAGIDKFPHTLVGPYLQPWADKWGIPLEQILAVGSDDDPTVLNMAHFCLRQADRANGVSRLHGEVSRELFADVEGGSDIGSITNGVHAPTWVSPHLQTAFNETLGESWSTGDEVAWGRVDQLDDDRVRALRLEGKSILAGMVAEKTGVTMDPSALIVGFARRFATYKRANILLRHAAELAAVLADDERPIHFLFAGKAHPADVPGKKFLADIVAYGDTPESNGRFTFVPDYDIGIAKALYAGCDVWLNTPVRPREASGTSGEKSTLNGGLNLSILDGWWAEMFDGHNGWAIPTSDLANDEKRDDAEGMNALEVLTNEVLPLYYADGSPLSSAWLTRVRHNWTSLGPRVTAARMVADYRDHLYTPARLVSTTF